MDRRVDLNEFFGPRALNEDLVRGALRGALDLTIHTREGRVMVRKVGRRVSDRLPGVVEAEVLRAHNEGALWGLLPKRGRNSIPVCLTGVRG
jgi:hypothetical protein